MKASAPHDPPIPAALWNLAPLRLPSHRRQRYGGDGLCVALARLAPRDRTLLRRLYRRLSELLRVLADLSTDDARKWDGIARWTQRHGLDNLMRESREIGLASHAQAPGEDVGKVIHDVRGGTFTGLLGCLQLLDFLRTQPGVLNTLFVQTRDHLKIMRHALTGLDEPRREAGRTPGASSMRATLERWRCAVSGLQWHYRPLRMDIDCRYDGPLAECDLESAALDRIFHNLANNAGRHAVDGCVEMAVFPLPEPPGDCLRMVLSNTVCELDYARLRAVEQESADGSDPGTERDLFALFAPGTSSTGSGYGLTVVADFVANAFGLHDRMQALRERYVGAVLDGYTFRVWFHWPTARTDLPPKLDDYHHPKDSLSGPA